MRALASERGAAEGAQAEVHAGRRRQARVRRDQREEAGGFARRADDARAAAEAVGHQV